MISALIKKVAGTRAPARRKAARPRRNSLPTDNRILITGVGRSGTTFLVQLFTALGFDTGFSLDEALTTVDPIAHAGLERWLFEDHPPYVIKVVGYTPEMRIAIHKGWLDIGWAIIPLRDLGAAAGSRRRVHAEACARGLDPEDQAGSLWLTTDPDEQEVQLAVQFYETTLAVARSGAPILFPEFPRLIDEPLYLYSCLENLMAEHDVGVEEFLTAHAKIAQREKVNIRVRSEMEGIHSILNP